MSTCTKLAFNPTLRCVGYARSHPARTILSGASGMPRACRKCGVMEVGGVRFEKCGKCKGVAAADVAYYCSRECQIADWPTHARWHADHDRMSAGIAVGAAMPGIGVAWSRRAASYCTTWRAR